MMTIRTSRTAFAGLLGRGLADMTEIRKLIYPLALGEETAPEYQLYITNDDMLRRRKPISEELRGFAQPPSSPNPGITSDDMAPHGPQRPETFEIGHTTRLYVYNSHITDYDTCFRGRKGTSTGRQNQEACTPSSKRYPKGGSSWTF